MSEFMRWKSERLHSAIDSIEELCRLAIDESTFSDASIARAAFAHKILDLLEEAYE